MAFCRSVTCTELPGHFFSLQPGADPIHGPINRCTPQSALPDNSDPPLCSLQVQDIAGVTDDVGIELGLPERGARRRGGGVTTARVPMPEAAVDQNGGTPAGQDQVRSTRQAPYMQAISEAPGVQRAAQDQLRLRVTPAYTCHHP